MLIAGWENPLLLLKQELDALEYEGFEVPTALRHQVDALDPVQDAWNEPAIEAIRNRLSNLQRRVDFPFGQPDELNEIRSLRPKDRPKMKSLPGDAALLDRFHGAWLGRFTGCALGKPVEGLGMQHGWKGIRQYLEARGAWPLADYFQGNDAGDGVELICRNCCREQIRCMVADDDVNYTLIGLLTCEQHGAEFTWRDIAEMWDTMLPYNQICTAETQALLNYHICKSRMNPGANPAVPAFTRRYNNPFREWIGAQIRADFWAWAAAGQPELAAGFAWRDASWTHTANGIYGAMFIAALEAAAFVESDPRRLIEIGLSEIPADCRLAAELRETVAQITALGEFEAYMRWHSVHFSGMSPVHTVNNACIVAMALLLGEGDPDRSICLSVAAGLDTDCNGATVGAITGILRGGAAFGGRLAPRLNNTLEADLPRFQHVSITSLAERTLEVYHKLNL